MRFHDVGVVVAGKLQVPGRAVVKVVEPVRHRMAGRDRRGRNGLRVACSASASASTWALKKASTSPLAPASRSERAHSSNRRASGGVRRRAARLATSRSSSRRVSSSSSCCSTLISVIWTRGAGRSGRRWRDSRRFERLPDRGPPEPGEARQGALGPEAARRQLERHDHFLEVAPAPARRGRAAARGSRPAAAAGRAAEAVVEAMIGSFSTAGVRRWSKDAGARRCR